jgi:hypothetical protein
MLLLLVSDIPIEAVVGCGYCLRNGFRISPLLINDGEVTVLISCWIFSLLNKSFSCGK